MLQSFIDNKGTFWKTMEGSSLEHKTGKYLKIYFDKQKAIDLVTI